MSQVRLSCPACGTAWVVPAVMAGIYSMADCPNRLCGKAKMNVRTTVEVAHPSTITEPKTPGLLPGQMQPPKGGA